MTTSTPFVNDTRFAAVRFLETQLVGPADGPTEVLPFRERPVNRYLMGILFPQEPQAEVPVHTYQDLIEPPEDAVEDDLSSNERDDTGAPQDPTFLAGKWQPSSVGLSLYTDAPELTASVWGALYVRTRGSSAEEWHRKALAEADAPEEVTLRVPHAMRGGIQKENVLAGHAQLHALWRRLPQGWLVTVSLVNPRTRLGRQIEIEDCLFQVGVSCQPSGGTIMPYPEFQAQSLDPEEDELRLLFRRHHTYGVGHGCAPVWDPGANRVASAFVPWSEVRPLTQDVPGLGPDILNIAMVAWGQRPRAEIVAKYAEMVDVYRTWIAGLLSSNADIPEHLEPARERLRGRLQTALTRMDAGVALLRDNDEAWRAYVIASRAMLMQMHHVSREMGGTRRSRQEAIQAMPKSYDHGAMLKFSWRPFQLAFMLMTVTSLTSHSDVWRETVDLIWFPTGGGKTEAYLLAAAYVMVLRRHRHGPLGGGTAVITRYTLRLLTAQQFRRTSTLICALEWLRVQDTTDRLGLGDESFTVGLWVGGDSTPNEYGQALEKFQELRAEAQPASPFILDACPWCGTEIIPRTYSQDDASYGVRTTTSSFALHCTNSACDFHGQLPVQVVDDGLYAQPPTFLLGTVDKFAMVAWKEQAGRFFGSDEAFPPDLIIQDELHLLSGPLGTTVGLYECALQQLPMLRGGRPKIIASTATIRRASEQVGALFNREVQLFPPSGLDADDSFFARRDDDPARPGRLYVGVMSPHQSMKTAMTQLGAALVELPQVVSGLPVPLQQSYATLVMYFNSLRELGQGRKIAQDDITSRLHSVFNRPYREIYTHDQVEELTSNLDGGELTDILSQLARDPSDGDHVAVLATSNMLSVGVDIGRLGLMLMAGQPKTSSEYIQATSRVGRDARRPGMVIVLYSPGKPRDRSHYESFPTYHGSLYRYVEPTSVTPFALPSRLRALHAVLGILVRHTIPGMSAESAAVHFDRTLPQVQEIVGRMLEWVMRVDPAEEPKTREQLERLVSEWQEQATALKAMGRPLQYGARGRNIAGIYRPADDSNRNGLWPTLQNMRSVDESSSIQIKTR